MPSDNVSSGITRSIVIGFEDSDCSVFAVEDLAMAGLPDTGEATVIAVAELAAMTGAMGYGYAAVSPDEIAAGIDAIKESAKKSAARGAALLKKVLPGWSASALVKEGSSYWSLIEHAEQTGAGLIVIGSHGRSAFKRMLLGSTSQFVLSHAPCSVRIGRRRGQATPSARPRLLVAVDGSAYSDAVVESVARRNWPQGTEAILLIAVDVGTSVSIRSRAARNAGVATSPEDVLERAARVLAPAGLNVSAELLAGHPKDVIVGRAEEVAADCIFLGSKGHTGLARIALGSVAAAVAARAHCSVEVVRSGQG